MLPRTHIAAGKKKYEIFCYDVRLLKVHAVMMCVRNFGIARLHAFFLALLAAATSYCIVSPYFNRENLSVFIENPID